MARIKTETITVNIVIVVTLFQYLCPGVTSDDTTPIPANKDEVSNWFNSIVKPHSERKDLDPILVKAEANPKHIKVSQDGKGDFKSIQDAVKSIPSKNTQRVIISIAGGNYTERVRIERDQPFVTLYGDPNDRPSIIHYTTAAQEGTVQSATVYVDGDYFMGINLNIINSAPRPDGIRKGAQAVALTQSGDKAAYYNCKLHGFQDTFCDDKGKHFFKDCYIEGTVDFIFGNGKTIYLDTELHVIEGVIAAQARHTNAEDTGYSFVHCRITGEKESGVLGRGWMAFSRVIYAYTEMGDAVRPVGWHGVPGKPHYGGTTYFGEYKNTGPGAKMDGRADFVKKMSDADVKPFISLGFIEGSKWLLPPIKV